MQSHKFSYLQQDWEALDFYWQQFFSSTCFNELKSIDQQLTKIAQSSIIYPPKGHIFKALNELTHETIKIVILGQDPYHGENEATGLAFAVNQETKIPPSLRNIFKELDLEFPTHQKMKPDTTLENWKQQGVLLLNSSLTVIKDQANSLAKIGWETITDSIIKHISITTKSTIFMLWGNYARSKKTLINSDNYHFILESVHPSPLSANRGFFGCNHFINANNFLKRNQLPQINWL